VCFTIRSKNFSTNVKLNRRKLTTLAPERCAFFIQRCAYGESNEEHLRQIETDGKLSATRKSQGSKGRPSKDPRPVGVIIEAKLGAALIQHRSLPACIAKLQNREPATPPVTALPKMKLVLDIHPIAILADYSRSSTSKSLNSNVLWAVHIDDLLLHIVRLLPLRRRKAN
jgi:hypothetical protein